MILESLISFFTSGGVHKVALVSNVASNVVKAFENEYQQDHDGKKAAIDTLVYLLNQYKQSLPSPSPSASADNINQPSK